MRIVVTGGCGFIGSHLIRELLESNATHQVLNIDLLTYAGNRASTADYSESDRYEHVTVDISDALSIAELFGRFRPEAVMHLAAESHVDRSISGPAVFINTNIVGTYTLLEQSRAYLRDLPPEEADRFRFIHVSTDEVFGSLGEEGYFTEATPYAPRSPYSASKAASDHLARAWHHTFGLPVIVTNCSNNYGPYQFPEKLIPVVILKALSGEKIPVYGKGENVRDWLFVRDHADALIAVLDKGHPGETYNIGGNSERRNIDVVKQICCCLDELRPSTQSYGSRIEFVRDRPGHDLRYAIDASKIRNELGWTPSVAFESGIRATVRWYLENEFWWREILASKHSLKRIGLLPQGEKEGNPSKQ